MWKLDRLSRSLKDLLHILERVDAVGARFRSIIIRRSSRITIEQSII